MDETMQPILELAGLHLFLLVALGFCCRGLIDSIRNKVPLFVTATGFSKTALRISRSYKTFAFSVLTASFFAGVIISSYRLIIEL